MRDLATAVLRTSPDYDLVLLDRLPQAQRDAVRLRDADDGLYGVLRPRPGRAGEPRAVSVDTALLLMTLREPGGVPGYVRAGLGDQLHSVISRLVLDGVLELADGGGYVSGVRARALLDQGTHRVTGRTGQLSVEALQYGQELVDLPVRELAFRLYAYGRIPVSRLWRRLLPHEDAVREHLGTVGSGRARSVLDEHWVEVVEHHEHPYWRTWRPRQVGAGIRSGGYKLYVAAHPSSLPEVFPKVAECLAGAPGVRAFKVGRDVDGLCRPDSLVAYFTRLVDLHAATLALRQALAGSRAQAVPFTAEVTPDGLLSWAVDPPAVGRDGAGSWRWWVVDRLAEYLHAASSTHPDPVEPWRFAVHRLRLDGVDTERWLRPEHAGAGRQGT